MAASEDGKRAMAEIREEAKKPGGHVERLERIMDMALEQIEEALKARSIPPHALALNYGILSDKHARLVGPKQDAQKGPLIFEVRGFSAPEPATIDVKALPIGKRPRPKADEDEEDAGGET